MITSSRQSAKRWHLLHYSTFPGGEITPAGIIDWTNCTRIQFIHQNHRALNVWRDVWCTEARFTGDLAEINCRGFETGHAYAKAIRMVKKLV